MRFYLSYNLNQILPARVLIPLIFTALACIRCRNSDIDPVKEVNPKLNDERIEIKSNFVFDFSSPSEIKGYDFPSRNMRNLIGNMISWDILQTGHVIQKMFYSSDSTTEKNWIQSIKKAYLTDPLKEYKIPSLTFNKDGKPTLEGLRSSKLYDYFSHRESFENQNLLPSEIKHAPIPTLKRMCNHQDYDKIKHEMLKIASDFSKKDEIEHKRLFVESNFPSYIQGSNEVFMLIDVGLSAATFARYRHRILHLGELEEDDPETSWFMDAQNQKPYYNIDAYSSALSEIFTNEKRQKVILENETCHVSTSSLYLNHINQIERNQIANPFSKVQDYKAETRVIAGSKYLMTQYFHDSKLFSPVFYQPSGGRANFGSAVDEDPPPPSGVGGDAFPDKEIGHGEKLLRVLAESNPDAYFIFITHRANVVAKQKDVPNSYKLKQILVNREDLQDEIRSNARKDAEKILSLIKTYRVNFVLQAVSPNYIYDLRNPEKFSLDHMQPIPPVNYVEIFRKYVLSQDSDVVFISALSNVTPDILSHLASTIKNQGNRIRRNISDFFEQCEFWVAQEIRSSLLSTINGEWVSEPVPSGSRVLKVGRFATNEEHALDLIEFQGTNAFRVLENKLQSGYVHAETADLFPVVAIKDENIAIFGDVPLIGGYPHLYWSTMSAARAALYSQSLIYFTIESTSLGVALTASYVNWARKAGFWRGSEEFSALFKRRFPFAVAPVKFKQFLGFYSN
jgi:hypothetical protein